ncbi:MAG: hypothetical protein UR52_C0001G0019 [Candidatus Gottesmanbacteria bacterium GW2011_GWA1_34_13]|uniref:Methyltransferase domain-containing protein n=1 Tax=Candidatus Gottesmanbacteria bacterium GW2011_GWA1_34_13 TaxID=1618434 RepID=A0A0G0ASP4_9BACT|nr:MAG: hypothetical protein UR52_C0001G0019 [Candidatus Gottesmanbacteria bacterium GW2011_GWA1_34_13]
MTIINFLRNIIIPIKEINVVLPKNGFIYEVGSGYGSLANAISNNYPDRKVIGLDFDQNKILRANCQVKTKNLQFMHADALKFEYKECDGVIMSDFLHHIDYKKQVMLLQKIEKKIRKSGLLIIKEIDENDSWRRNMSRIWDLLLYPKDAIYYRSKNDWTKIVRKLSYDVKIKRTNIFFPGSTYLYICRKI